MSKRNKKNKKRKEKRRGVAQPSPLPIWGWSNHPHDLWATPNDQNPLIHFFFF
jgi:hypothetical protein